MASPAQVANDMAVRADYWRGRSADVQKACHNSATMIRNFLNGDPVSGQAYCGLERRLARLEAEISNWSNQTQIRGALTRARLTLAALKEAEGARS